MACVSDQRKYSSSLRTLPGEETFPPRHDDGPSVWVGFLEDVPVIGTVREGVEWVLAVYEGNQSVVKQTEDAIKNSLCAPPQESLQEPMMKLAIPEKPEAGAASGGHLGSAGLHGIREVSVEIVVEYVQNATKNKKGQQRKQQASEETLMKIQERVLDTIKLIKPDFTLKEALLDQLIPKQRSKRGEHVFNNNILKFHKKLLNEMNLRLSEENLSRLGSHSLDENTACEISEKMVTNFDEEELYVNSNAILYGEYCRQLRLALSDILNEILSNIRNHINPNNVSVSKTSGVNEIICHMNNKEVYVDHYAKEKWIRQDRNPNRKPNRTERFDRVKRNVADMYQNKRGVEWCFEIMRNVE